MQYYSPDSFSSAADIASKAQGSIRFLAGGTDVLVQLRSDIFTPDTLIDIKKAEGAKSIERTEDGGWRIGAAVAGAEMSEHAELKNEWPGVVEAVDLIGSTQIQGRATLVGNLCNGSPAADSVPALVASDARIVVQSPSGERIISVMDIPKSPGKTNLEKGDVVKAVLLPARAERSGDAYLRFIPRSEMDIAVAGCGVWLKLDKEGVVSAARVSLGAVAPTVLDVDAAAKAIIGTKLDDAALENMAAAASAACNPITDRRGTVEYRTHLAGVLAKRAAKIAYTRAGGSQ